MAYEILIARGGYTETAYAACEGVPCTAVVLQSIGLPESLAVQHADVSVFALDDETTVEIVILGESDSCEWCACCGEFIRHGIVYENEKEAGCQHGGDGEWAPDLPGPHPSLIDAPAMRKYWGVA